MRRVSSPLGYTIILLSAVLFGTYGVWSRLMGPTFGPFYQAWVRSLIIMALMLPFLLATRSFRKIERADWPAAGVFIAFCVCTQVPLYYAFNHAPIGTVQLIFYSVFVITAYLVGKLYLGETITRVKLLAMVLAFAGLAVVFGVSALSFAPLGLLLAAGNGMASGGEVSSTKKISDKYSPALLAFWGWAFTFLLHLPISLLLHERQVVPRPDHAWLWLVVYSVVNAAAFWLVIEGYRYVDASIGSLIGLSEIIFAIIFGAIIFHQRVTWNIGVGGVMILAAATLPDVLNLRQGRGNTDVIEPIREL